MSNSVYYPRARDPVEGLGLLIKAARFQASPSEIRIQMLEDTLLTPGAPDPFATAVMVTNLYNKLVEGYRARQKISQNTSGTAIPTSDLDRLADVLKDVTRVLLKVRCILQLNADGPQTGYGPNAFQTLFPFFPALCLLAGRSREILPPARVYMFGTQPVTSYFEQAINKGRFALATELAVENGLIQDNVIVALRSLPAVHKLLLGAGAKHTRYNGHNYHITNKVPTSLFFNKIIIDESRDSHTEKHWESVPYREGTSEANGTILPPQILNLDTTLQRLHMNVDVYDDRWDHLQVLKQVFIRMNHILPGFFTPGVSVSPLSLPLYGKAGFELHICGKTARVRWDHFNSMCEVMARCGPHPENRGECYTYTQVSIICTGDTKPLEEYAEGLASLRWNHVAGAKVVFEYHPQQNSLHHCHALAEKLKELCLSRKKLVPGIEYFP